VTLLSRYIRTTTDSSKLNIDRPRWSGVPCTCHAPASLARRRRRLFVGGIRRTSGRIPL